MALSSEVVYVERHVKQEYKFESNKAFRLLNHNVLQNKETLQDRIQIRECIFYR